MPLLQDKVVVITGAGRGLGRAYALRFAREGACVVVNDVGSDREGFGEDIRVAQQVVEEILQEGGRAVANTDTVATQEGARRAIETAVTAFGRVDVLVNNAGIVRDSGFLHMDPSSWDDVLAVVLRGTLFCAQAFTKQVLQQGSKGRMINTLSTSGLLGNVGQANYAAANAGLYGLTRTLAIELQKKKITVNAIAPLAKTRMTEGWPLFRGVESLTPEHVVPAALFFASDLCGDRTGHVLNVAGARMYSLKLVETEGRWKETEDGVWSPEEIEGCWDSLLK